MNTPDESLAALLLLLSVVLTVALYVWTALAVSAMFRKMGEEPWKAWVPFLNTATLLQWGGFNPWLVLLSLVPVAQIVVYVLVVISAHRINPGFGYGNGMTALAALLFVVWASILGFGPARWLGARAAGRRGGASAGSGSLPAGPAGAVAGARAAGAVAGAAAAPAASVAPDREPEPWADAPGAGDWAGGVAPAVGARAGGASTAAGASTGGIAPAAGPAGSPGSAVHPDLPAPAQPSGSAPAPFAPPAASNPASAWTPPDTTPHTPERSDRDADGAPAASGSASTSASPAAAVSDIPSRPSAASVPSDPSAAPESAASGTAASRPAASTTALVGDSLAHAAPVFASSSRPGAGDAPSAPVAGDPARDGAVDDVDALDDGDAAWPSEIDDVSAIYPSPFPPSPAGGGPYAAPPVSGMGDLGGLGGTTGGTTGGRSGVAGTTAPDALRAGSRPAPDARAAGPGAPIAFVPGLRPAGAATPPPPPVTRVPAARRAEPVEPVTPDSPSSAEFDGGQSGRTRGESTAPGASPAAAIFAQPARARRTYEGDDPDAFPELSGEVSAVVGSPSAGAPRSAVGAVSAQHRRNESGELEPHDDRPDARASRASDDDAGDDEVLDQTVIARRNVRPVWELVPASGSPILLSATVVILGRRPASDAAYPTAQLVAVPGDARTVSKTHARIELRGDAWVVTDLGSTNGVLVRTLMGDEVEVEVGGQLDAGERFFLGDEEFHLRRIDI